MQIRTEQMAALNNAMARRFEDEMVAHLAEFSPPLFRVIKEDQMREATRFGIQKAGRYGFTLRGPICLYLELMLLFGSHFDTDPQYSWANEILIDQDSLPEMERAVRLYEKGSDYQEKVSGPDNANTVKALRELSVIAREQVTVSANEFAARMIQEMKRVFPQKALYVGDEGLAAIIRHGIAEARKYDFPSTRGEGLIVILMFAFGNGCTNDLLYPWISRTLKDEKIIEPAARAERLEKKALTWLDHVLALPAEGLPT
jgi:hypothetical protein